MMAFPEVTTLFAPYIETMFWSLITVPAAPIVDSRPLAVRYREPAPRLMIPPFASLNILAEDVAIESAPYVETNGADISAYVGDASAMLARP